MRLLLLLALLLRLAPDPTLMGMGKAHCAKASAEMAAHGGGHTMPGHHDHSATPGNPADCPHCPPADCARQSQCAEGHTSLALLPTDGPFAAAAGASLHPVSHAPLASVTQTPPTRPPASPLA
jgi:hypothetical protein